MALLEWAMLPGISVLKSSKHLMSHSVPGIKSQQTTVQSPSTVVNIDRLLKATSDVDVESATWDVGVAGIREEKPTSHSKVQSKSLSSSSIMQISWQAPSVAPVEVTGVRCTKPPSVVVVTVTITVEDSVDVGVAGKLVLKPPSQKTSHSTPWPRSKLGRLLQTAVQPLLVIVTTDSRLARIGLPVTWVALTVHTRLTRPKTTDLVIRILPTVVKLMDDKKNVWIVYLSLSDVMR